VTEPIILSEYNDSAAHLHADDARFISQQLRGRIAINRPMSGVGYVLNPGQHVGMITLPSGLRLECRPKVPARNLFHMLTIAYELPDPFLDAPAEVDRIEDILALVVAHFAHLVEVRIDLGLYRAYVEAEDNLHTVRGRIAIADDIRHNHVLRHRTYCRYAEYAWDVPENQALRQVVRLLAGWRLPGELRRRLWALDAALQEVAPGRFVAADIGRFTYNRLNADYRPLHALCRLFLEGASPSEVAGQFGFEAFLFDMNRLFESFVTRVLGELLLPPFKVDAQAPITLDVGATVPIRPDIVLRRSGEPLLVADCKYKRLPTDADRQQDLYQMLAYCTALGIDHGMLVYPQHLTTIHRSITVRHAGTVIGAVSIDLGGDREALSAASDQLAQAILQTVQSGRGLQTATA
jgi:5-methylcytosine-specific restriction enzyme subunit McrC